MTTTNLTPWLNALETKTRFNPTYLRCTNPDEFCPLGVLCDISELGEWKFVPKTYLPNANSLMGSALTYVTDETDMDLDSSRGTTILPKLVQEYYRLATPSGTFRTKFLSKATKKLLDERLVYPMSQNAIALLPSFFSKEETVTIISELLENTKALQRA